MGVDTPHQQNLSTWLRCASPSARFLRPLPQGEREKPTYTRTYICVAGRLYLKFRLLKSPPSKDSTPSLGKTMKRLALVAATLAVLAGCSQQESTTIKIGVAAPMTGSNAAFGEQFRRGAEKAVADINAAGGVSRQLELVVGDDAGDPKQAVSVANDMASQGVVFVAGHYNSGSSIPASDVYAENSIVQISPGSTNPTLTERNLPNVFRVCGRDDQQGPIAAEYVAAQFRRQDHRRDRRQIGLWPGAWPMNSRKRWRPRA